MIYLQTKCLDNKLIAGVDVESVADESIPFAVCAFPLTVTQLTAITVDITLNMLLIMSKLKLKNIFNSYIHLK